MVGSPNPNVALTMVLTPIILTPTYGVADVGRFAGYFAAHVGLRYCVRGGGGVKVDVVMAKHRDRATSTTST